MLEVLVHTNLPIPPKHHQAVRITIPDALPCESLPGSELKGWDAEDVAMPAGLATVDCRSFAPRFYGSPRWSQNDASTTF